MTIEFVVTLCVVGSSLKAAGSTVNLTKHSYESKSNALGSCSNMNLNILIYLKWALV